MWSRWWWWFYEKIEGEISDFRSSDLVDTLNLRKVIIWVILFNFFVTREHEIQQSKANILRIISTKAFDDNPARIRRDLTGGRKRRCIPPRKRGRCSDPTTLIYIYIYIYIAVTLTDKKLTRRPSHGSDVTSPYSVTLPESHDDLCTWVDMNTFILTFF